MSYVPTPGAHTLSPPSAHPPAPEAPAAIGHTSAHHPAAPTTAGGLPLLVDHSLVSVHQRPPASHNAPHAPPAHPQAAPPQPAHVGLHGVPPSLTSTPAPSVPQGPPVVPPLSIPRGSEHVPQVLPQEGGAHAPPEVKSSEYVQRIGSLLDEMSSTVSGACEQFQSGQFHSSSERLGHVKTLLKAVGDVGAACLATAVNEQQQQQQQRLDSAQQQQPQPQPQQQPQPGSVPLTNPATPASPKLTPQEQHQLLSAALFCTVQMSPESRKRRISLDLSATDNPIKVHRGEESAAAAPSEAPNFGRPEAPPPHSSTELPTDPFAFHGSPNDVLSQAHHMLGMQPPVSESSTLLSVNALSDNPTARSTGSGPSVSSTPQFDTTGSFSTPVAGQSAHMSPDEALRLAMDPGTFHGHDEWAVDASGTLAEGEEPEVAHSVRDRSNSGTDPALDGGIDEFWEGITLSERQQGATELSMELRERLDKIFLEFLNALCSNLEATDERGELIHQTLMPKKMARLDESWDFRPFKFRIQAFTNAFQSEVYRRGISENDCSIKKIKQFLWTQPYISRFNIDGKKSKSKGNHVWNVVARKLPEGGWTFRTFSPKITGAASKVARVNERWTWHLGVWDPQASPSSIKVVYSVNKLPPWIHWEDKTKVLTGVPPDTAQSGEISVTALYVHLGQLHRLEHSFFLQVLPATDHSAVPPDAREPVAAPGGAPSAHMPMPADPTATPTDRADASAAVHFVQPPFSGTGQVAGGALSGLGISGHDGLPAQERESVKYEVVEPSRASDLLSSVQFPFTPPLYMDKRPQNLSLDRHMPPQAPQQQAPSAPVQPALQLSNGLQQAGTPAPPPFGHPHPHMFKDHAHHPPVEQSPATEQYYTPATQSPSTRSHSNSENMHNAHLRSVIERRQQENMSSFMLSMPSRGVGFNVSEHPGQGTPISSLPNDMSLSLPQVTPSE